MSKKTKIESYTILGPTASGKTALAVALAQEIEGEIISIDSRQFYSQMDLGTGKDLHEYGNIPYHLIDIAPAGEKLNVSDFKKLFFEAYHQILSRNKTPILCGGTGNYLLSILQNSSYTEVPAKPILREQLHAESHPDLISKIQTLNLPPDYKPDTSTKKRCVRTLEILDFLSHNELPQSIYKPIKTQLFGLNPPTDIRRKRINQRLDSRLKNGLIEEIQHLRSFIPDQDLIYYGLEYNYLTQSLNGSTDFNTAKSKLETEIHRFAKRQMTFFRKIERDGFAIDWIPFELNNWEKATYILKKGNK